MSRTEGGGMEARSEGGGLGLESLKNTAKYTVPQPHSLALALLCL